jgi:hypothetical protein
MKNFVLTLVLSIMVQQVFGGVCDCFIESHRATNFFFEFPSGQSRLIKSFKLGERVPIRILQKTAVTDNHYVWHMVMVDSFVGFVPASVVFCLEKDSLAKEGSFRTQLNPPTDAKHMNLRTKWLNRYNTDLKKTAEISWQRISSDPTMLDYVYTQCEKHGVPYESAVLALIESAWKPHDENGSHAAGYWQFIPGTAREMGLIVNDTLDQRLDPYLSTDAAIRYLRSLYDKCKSEAVKSRYTCSNDDLWHFAFSAYNRGPAKVKVTFHQAKGDFGKYLDYIADTSTYAETRNYVPKLYALRQWLLENVGGIPRVIYQSPADVALQGYQDRLTQMGQATLDLVKGMYQVERKLLGYRQSYIDGVLAKL